MKIVLKLLAWWHHNKCKLLNFKVMTSLLFIKWWHLRLQGQIQDKWIRCLRVKRNQWLNLKLLLRCRNNKIMKCQNLLNLIATVHLQKCKPRASSKNKLCYNNKTAIVTNLITTLDSKLNLKTLVALGSKCCLYNNKNYITQQQWYKIFQFLFFNKQALQTSFLSTCNKYSNQFSNLWRIYQTVAICNKWFIHHKN